MVLLLKSLIAALLKSRVTIEQHGCQWNPRSSRRGYCCGWTPYRDSASAQPSDRRRLTVLYTIAVVLLVLWLLGMVSGYTIGAFIHVLLVVAIVLLLVQVISGRTVAP